MDMGNMLKPKLARGELQMVGATTLDEYRQIEKVSEKMAYIASFVLYCVQPATDKTHIANRVPLYLILSWVRVE